MSASNSRKNCIRFLPALAVFALVSFIRHFKFTMSTYNTTLLALNYDYGFIPKGLVGTCFQYLTQNWPALDWNYMGAFNFSGLFTLVFFILLFVFYHLCLKQCPDEHKRNLKHLLVLLSIFAFPMYTTSVNFGCLDLYLSIVLLLCLILFVWGKLEWLILPLGIIGMCISHEFLFTHAMLIGVLLVYKCWRASEKKKWYYGVLLAFFLSSTLTLFSYFDNYSYENPTEIASELKISAKALSESGKSYGKTYIKEEILGEDLSLTTERFEQNQDNLQDFPVFLVLFSPYLVGTLCLFLRMLGEKSISRSRQIIYLLLLFGSISLLPLLLNDIYYGRYMYQLVFYYIAAFSILFALGDTKMPMHFEATKNDVKKLTPMTFVWFLYPVLLTPFRAVAISSSINKLAEVLFTELTYFIQP